MTDHDDDGPLIFPPFSMTLRDCFAAQAMAAYIGTYPCPATSDDFQPEMGDIAADAYAMADAMLEARTE